MARTLTLTLSVALTLWLAAASFAQAQASAPAFKEGDTWQFKFETKNAIKSLTDSAAGTYEIVFTQGNIKLYETEGGRGRGGEIPITNDILSQTLLTQVGKNEQQILKFPLSVGQKWSYKYTYASMRSGRFGTSGQNREVQVNVIGMEDVTTPAGTFKTFKLVRVEGYFAGARGGNYARETYTYFYSPDTKSVVKISSVNDNDPVIQEGELIKFTPGS